MYPTAVDLKLENRRQQSRKRPIEAIVDGVSSFNGMIEGREIWDNGFVGDGGIIKRERAYKETVARNTVRVNRMR